MQVLPNSQSVLSSNQSSACVSGDSGWMVDFFGLQQPWTAPCKAVAEAKAHAERRGHALLIVGQYVLADVPLRSF